jgi:hypothetical protein
LYDRRRSPGLNGAIVTLTALVFFGPITPVLGEAVILSLKEIDDKFH